MSPWRRADAAGLALRALPRLHRVRPIPTLVKDGLGQRGRDRRALT